MTFINVMFTIPTFDAYISFPDSAVFPCITVSIAVKLTPFVVLLKPVVNSELVLAKNCVQDVDSRHAFPISKEAQLALVSHCSWQSAMVREVEHGLSAELQISFRPTQPLGYFSYSLLPFLFTYTLQSGSPAEFKYASLHVVESWHLFANSNEMQSDRFSHSL
jgi:hypothetical protein